MATQGAYVLNSPIASTDTSLQILQRDPIFGGTAADGTTIAPALNSGIRYMFDLTFPFSYPGGSFTNPQSRAAAAAPTAAQTVYDMAELADGDYEWPTVITTGSLAGPAYSGGGFDFTASGGYEQGVRSPASALADLWTAFGGNSQRWLLWGYFKLPTSANWNTTATLQTLMSAGNVQGGYTVAPDLVNIAMSNTAPGSINARRQTAAATVAASLTATLLQPASFGALAQIAYYRTGAGEWLRVKTGVETLLVAGGSNAINTQNFSTHQMVWGRPSSFGTNANTPSQISGLRLYRGVLENLARSGRTPATVLDQDWGLVQAQITRSAAANGGTSLIFV